jgi:Flp pilus assembly protein TadB
MRVSWMLFSLFGLVVVERTIISLVSMKLILPDQAQVLRVFFLFLQIVINILLRDHILLLVAVQFVWFGLPDLFAVIVQKQRESLFQEQLISMLDSWIITMRSGKSLRQAQLFYLEKTTKAGSIHIK